MKQIQKTFKAININDSLMDFISINAKVQNCKILESKIGGYPYWNTKLDYPTNNEGEPLKLLAQINFEEAPNLKNYPNKGMLQFFIDDSDGAYGVNFDDNTAQGSFRVVYHEDINDNFSLDDFKPSYDFPEGLDDFPVMTESKMEFKLDRHPASVSDYRFEKIYDEDPFDILDEEDEFDSYSELYSGRGHKIGGYAHFTQVDPRQDYEEASIYDTLLFQLDTDNVIDMMWGDCGVANFFIQQEDLINLKFNDIYYTYDCF